MCEEVCDNFVVLPLFAQPHGVLPLGQPGHEGLVAEMVSEKRLRMMKIPKDF